MNDTQTDKVGMYRKVGTLCTDHAADFSSVPQIAIIAAELSAKVTEIEDADTEAGADTTGYAETKAADRVALETYCRRTTRSLVTYAFEQNDLVLRRMVDFTPSELAGMRADKLLQTAQMLYDKATPLIAGLAGITAADLTAFNAAIKDFTDIIARPEEKIGEKSAYTELVAQRIAEADIIMEKMRIYMALFEDTNVLLYNQFLAAASIDDTGSTKSAGETTIDGVDAGGNKKVMNITYAASNVLVFLNTGAAELEFTLVLGSDVKGTVNVSVGATVTKTLGEIGPGGDMLRVKNLDVLTPGAYKVTLNT